MVNRREISSLVNRLYSYLPRTKFNNSFFFDLLAFRQGRIFSLTFLFFFFIFVAVFFLLFQVVSHFHSLDGNIRIEAMHKSNEAKPTTIEFIAYKMEILLFSIHWKIPSSSILNRLCEGRRLFLLHFDDILFFSSDMNKWAKERIWS